MTVHDCPHCDCDECEMCGAHIKDEPYITSVEYFKPSPMYSKQKTPGRTKYQKELCKECAGKTKSAFNSAIVHGWGEDD